MCLRVNGAQTASTRACVYCMYAKTHALIIRTRYGRARDNYRLLKLFGDWARERSLCQHTHLQRALLCPGLQTQSSSLSYSLSACAYLVCHPAPHRPLPPCLTHTHTSCCVLCEWRRVCGRWEVYSRMNHQSSLRLTSRMVDWAQKFPSSRMCGISLMISFVLFPPSVQKCTKLNLCLTSAY